MRRAALVTGAGNGIGETIAWTACDRGYRVGVLDRDAEAAARVAGELPDAIALTADITDDASVNAALDTFADAFEGPPTALVNNAGIVRFGALLDQSLDDWRAVVDVNLTGTFVTARAAARRMADAGGGVIVNLASINGLAPGPGSGAYSATKAAIAMLTQQMAIEWAPLGIRVNAVAPGFIDAGISAPLYTDPAVREGRGARVPLGRLGTGDDVAEAVLWLASDAAAYVAGHVLVVDGGVSPSVIAQLPRIAPA